MRRLALWIAAVAVSLAVHAMVTWRIGAELDEAVEAGTKRRMVDVLPDTRAEVEDLELLKFEQPMLEPLPEMLIPNRASVVVPDVADTALRAARGGGALVSGVGPGSTLPGPESAEQGTGLGDGADQFARYVDELREAGLDVLFVVDATGSMGWALDEVKTRVVDIIEWVRDLVPIARFGVVAFRDHGDPEFVVRIQSLTYSSAKLERFLRSVEAAGGGDLGESVYAGMRTAIEHGGWRRAGKRLVILIGDAPPHREESEELLRLVLRFHADGGQVTSLDVSDEANPALLEARLGRKVNRNLYRGEPSYDFARIAEFGGGDAATLDGELRLTRRLVNLIFGQRYAGELALALEAIEP